MRTTLQKFARSSGGRQRGKRNSTRFSKKHQQYELGSLPFWQQTCDTHMAGTTANYGDYIERYRFNPLPSLKIVPHDQAKFVSKGLLLIAIPKAAPNPLYSPLKFGAHKTLQPMSKRIM